MSVSASSRPHRTARAAVAAGVVGLTVIGAPSAFAALGAVGPVDAATGFPAYVADAGGTRLDLCLDSPFCLAAKADLTAPDGEAFWWNSEATMPTSGGSALMVLAVEAAYGGDTPGTASAFTRVRFRIDIAAGKTGTYTVRYPYGAKTYNVTTTGRRAINDTVDIGCISTGDFDPCAPSRFSLLTQGPVTNYLKWDPEALPATPAGFVGDASTPHRVVGGATNVFRVEGPDVGGPGVDFVETNLMTVQGRLAAAAPDAPPPADQTPPAAPAGVSGTAVSSTQINVSWGAVTGAAGYRVYRDGATVPVGPQQTATTFSDTGLPPSSTHRYQVTAVDGAGNESPLSAVAQATTAAAAGVPAAVVSPTNLRFGNVALRGARTLTTTVRNAGTAPLQISSMPLSGAGAARYTTGGTCSTATPVARGASCTVTVTYSPTARTQSLATLTVNSNAGRDTVAISGRGR